MDCESEDCFLRILDKKTSIENPQNQPVSFQYPASEARLELITVCLLQACESEDYIRSRGSVLTAYGLVRNGFEEQSAFSICATAVALFCHPTSRDVVETQLSRLVYYIARVSEDRDSSLVKSSRCAYRQTEMCSNKDPVQTPEWVQTAMAVTDTAMETYNSWLRRNSPDSMSSTSSTSTVEVERDRHRPHPYRVCTEQRRRYGQAPANGTYRRNEQGRSFSIQRSYSR